MKPAEGWWMTDVAGTMETFEELQHGQKSCDGGQVEGAF